MPLVVKSPPASARDIKNMGSIPGLGRSPGGGNGNPIQYFCLESPMGRGAGGLQSMRLQRVRHNCINLAYTIGFIQGKTVLSYDWDSGTLSEQVKFNRKKPGSASTLIGTLSCKTSVTLLQK